MLIPRTALQEINNAIRLKYELRKDDVTAITKVKELSDVLLSISKCREMRDAAQYSLDFLMKGNNRFKKDTLQTENGKVESEN